MNQRPEFDTSPELKRLFMRELEAWRKQSRLSINELSHRCGVSPSYLAHVGRYGRIPSKPVLILLALNFGMRQPRELFQAARLEDEWPFDGPLHLSSQNNDAEGFLSVKLNMEGLIDAITKAVKAERRPRTLSELLGGRPLRIGINLLQNWLYEKGEDGEPQPSRGIVPDLCRALKHSLQCDVEITPTPFDRYVERLCRGDIDIFGPLLVSPNCPPSIMFSTPIYRIGLSALFRVRPTNGLAPLEAPTSIEDIVQRPYSVAVFKDSRAHLYALTRLKRTEDQLLVCSSEEEAVERLILKGISRPAHLLVTSSVFAAQQERQHPEALRALFTEPGRCLEMSGNAFAIRPDWGDAVPTLNSALSTALTTSRFFSRLKAIIDEIPGPIEPESGGVEDHGLERRHPDSAKIAG